MESFYRIHAFCCTNRRPEGHARGSCAAKDSDALRNYMKARAKELGLSDTRINGCACLDECERGPVMALYPEGVWYTYKTTEDVEEILQSHVIKGVPVERLRLTPSKK